MKIYSFENGTKFIEVQNRTFTQSCFTCSIVDRNGKVEKFENLDTKEKNYILNNMIEVSNIKETVFLD